MEKYGHFFTSPAVIQTEPLSYKSPATYIIQREYLNFPLRSYLQTLVSDTHLFL